MDDARCSRVGKRDAIRLLNHPLAQGGEHLRAADFDGAHQVTENAIDGFALCHWWQFVQDAGKAIEVFAQILLQEKILARDGNQFADAGLEGNQCRL